MQATSLDRRASSVKWQRGMKELEGETGRRRQWWAEGGDCRWKDGSALRKGSLGGEGTRKIEVDGLSVYRCSLWDTSSVRNDGEPAFLQPRMPPRSLRASDKN
ncbi:hypothetical protein X777_03490 [Ooceraea biroi]|uniref:Uncharacterized protein n=1 Tax=Ooceraea biroi TaxID=2015173 RepID=A0A026WJM4_OOCBI|nr:hypothetical protein X777_03490 [Ooceraea biroi]